MAEWCAADPGSFQTRGFAKVPVEQRIISCCAAPETHGRARRMNNHAAFFRHCEDPTGPARSGRPDDGLRDEAIQIGILAWIASLRSQ